MSKKLDSATVERAETAFRDYLRDRDLKYTSERQSLLKVILGMEEHFEPDDLLVSMRQQGLRIGKATIYRTLPLLVDCGVLRKAFLGGSRSYYEHTLGPTPHDHMVCRNCGRVIEFDSTDILELRRRIAQTAGFKDVSHRFQILGLCSDCRGTGSENPS